MASVPSSSPPPPTSPPSASNSENSATSPTTALTPPNPLHLQLVDEGPTTNNGSLNVDDKKPDFPHHHFQFLDSTDYIEKFKKYEADYTFRLMAKYFSKKNLYGGNIFDENMTIDDEVIKSSRYNEIEACVFYLEFAYAAAEANLFEALLCEGGLVPDHMQTQCRVLKTKAAVFQLIQMKLQLIYQTGSTQ